MARGGGCAARRCVVVCTPSPRRRPTRHPPAGARPTKSEQSQRPRRPLLPPRPRIPLPPHHARQSLPPRLLSQADRPQGHGAQVAGRPAQRAARPGAPNSGPAARGEAGGQECESWGGERERVQVWWWRGGARRPTGPPRPSGARRGQARRRRRRAHPGQRDRAHAPGDNPTVHEQGARGRAGDVEGGGPAAPRDRHSHRPRPTSHPPRPTSST